MNELHDTILARLPASMQELSAATAVKGAPLWDAVNTLRQAGIIRRIGPAGSRVYELCTSTAPIVEPGVEVTPEEAAKSEKRQRVRPVVLFYIPGWPTQDPGRRMLWRICWNGEPAALREAKRMRRILGKDAEWEVTKMTPGQARKLRTKVISLRDLLERAKQSRES